MSRFHSVWPKILHFLGRGGELTHGLTTKFRVQSVFFAPLFTYVWYIKKISEKNVYMN